MVQIPISHTYSIYSAVGCRDLHSALGLIKLCHWYNKQILLKKDAKLTINK